MPEGWLKGDIHARRVMLGCLSDGWRVCIHDNRGPDRQIGGAENGIMDGYEVELERWTPQMSGETLNIGMITPSN